MRIIDTNESRDGFMMFGRLQVFSFGVVLEINKHATNAEFAINANPICSINTESWSSMVADMVQAQLIELNLIELVGNYYQKAGNNYDAWLTPPTQSPFTYDGEVGYVDHHEMNVVRVYYNSLRMVMRVCPQDLRDYLTGLGYK